LKQEAGNVEQLVHYWQTLPKSLKQEQELLIDYCRMLISLGAGARAEPLVAATLLKNWSSELVEIYGQIELNDPSRQLVVAEGWLKRYPEDPVLLFTLARLSLQNKLWGKARSYLEASISIEPSPESYQQLGLLLDQMGEPEKAMECFRAGLGLASSEPQKALPAIGQRPALTQSEEPVSPPSLAEGVQ
jgi:HemY protein